MTPDRVTPPASPFVLQAGAVIPAALITGTRSDLPGQITAQVTEPLYDSPTVRILLVPQGTRINVAPTLTIRPGFPVRVIVTRDIVLEPYGN